MWTKDFPSVEGFYFFYGRLFGKSYQTKLEVVSIFKTPSGFIGTAHNTFVYEKEAIGHWQRIPTPELPKEKKEDN